MSPLLPARKWEQYLHEVWLHWGLVQPNQPLQNLEQVVSLISSALGLPPQCARKELLALMEKFEERKSVTDLVFLETPDEMPVRA